MGIVSLHSIMAAPGVATEQVNLVVREPDAFTGHEDTCRGLYKKAHHSMGPKYDQQIAKCRKRAEKHAGNGIHGSGSNAQVNALARANSYEKLRDMDDFNPWFETDRRLFAQMDVDKSNFLDKTEFKELMKVNFGVKEEQAATIYGKYDVDQKDSIGIYEFCMMMSIWHSQLEYYENKHEADIEFEVTESAIPCMCCDGICVKYATTFGCCCSLCTLGLSWIPCWCMAGALTNDILESDHMDKERTKAREEGVKAAKKHTAKKLEAGPPANVLKPAECAK